VDDYQTSSFEAHPGSGRSGAPVGGDQCRCYGFGQQHIDMLGQMIQSNALTLKSKTMNDDDREALQRHMTTRMAHQKLLQQRLDRLSK
jgi:hypothetical protein